ncbi:MAG: FtsX-like permease family protein, partial [Alistipes sp.]|nr:FtsX-like permease family protein [Alistipes sp.]
LAGAIALGVIIFGVVVSLYPAWYITKFSPAFVIKGDFSASKSGRILRYTLIGIQFTISIVMIICSIFVYRQHQYMLSRDMGFDKENLLVVDVPSDAVYPTSYSWENPGIDYTRRNAFMDAIKHNPQIKDIAFGGSALVADDYYGSITDDLGDGREITCSTYYVSYNFLDVMGIDMVDGRSFLPSDEENHTGAYIFNETTAKEFELTAESSIKGHIRGTKAPVVGICKDFNFQSAHFEITPYAFLVRGKLIYNLPLHAYIRTVAGADIAEVREYIFDTIMEFAPDADPAKVDVKFFDNELELVYQREDKLSTLVTLFSFLSIVISIIGVFGLVLFETHYRRREIAIRRVYGASFSGILTMFNLKYVYIVAICSAIAIPLSYYVIDRWMQQYVYRVPMSWWVYAVAVAIILAITVITVTLRSWKAATENPADVVKNN